MGAEQIAEVVARATGIPVASLMAGERDKLLHMEARLAEQVVGQDEALRVVSDAVRVSRAGLQVVAHEDASLGREDLQPVTMIALR